MKCVSLGLNRTLSCASGEAAAAPCETPLMEKNSSKPAPAEPTPTPPTPTPRGPQRHPPSANCQMVAFKLGGSEEADLDDNDMETKDLDFSNGEKEMA